MASKTRKNKKLRKGGGKDLIIRGIQEEFKRILAKINIQSNKFRLLLKESPKDIDYVINEKHKLNLLSSKLLNSDMQIRSTTEISFTEDEMLLLHKYCPEEQILFNPVGTNLNHPILDDVAVEGTANDFFAIIKSIDDINRTGLIPGKHKYDNRITKLPRVQRKIRDTIHHIMDIYTYKNKIKILNHFGYNEKKYLISFTDDEYLLLNLCCKHHFLSSVRRITSHDTIPDYLDKAETINETHKRGLKYQRKTLARKEETSPYVKLTPSFERISPPVRLSLSLLKQKLSSRAKTQLPPSSVPRQTSDIEPFSDLNPLRHHNAIQIQPSDNLYVVPQSPLQPKQRRRKNSVKKEFYVGGFKNHSF